MLGVGWQYTITKCSQLQLVVWIFGTSYQPLARQGYLQRTTLQPRLSRRIEDGWHTGGPPAPPWRWTWGRAGAWPRWGPWRPAWSGPSTAPRWCRSLPHNIHPCTHCVDTERWRCQRSAVNLTIYSACCWKQCINGCVYKTIECESSIRYFQQSKGAGWLYLRQIEIVWKLPQNIVATFIRYWAMTPRVNIAIVTTHRRWREMLRRVKSCSPRGGMRGWRSGVPAACLHNQ